QTVPIRQVMPSSMGDRLPGITDLDEEYTEGHERLQRTVPATPAGPAERVETTVCRIIRDTRLADRIKALHNYECQLCGQTIILPDRSRYAEGHHIQPLGAPHDGPDTGDNVLCLCPNHHAACDLGAIRLAAADLRRADGHAVGPGFLDYHNRVVYRGS